MNKFIIIDGNAILHRAFHALPPLTSSKGEIANAVYGFFSMFLKIIEDVKPGYIVVCFDRPKPTFRQTLYVGYQQHRPKMDDDLVPQIAIVHKLLEKAGIPIFEVDGYEADDLIGTLAEQSQKSKVKSQNLNSKVKIKEDKNAGSMVEKTQNTQSASRSDDQKIGESESDIPAIRKSGLSEFSEPSENIEVIIVSGDRDMLQLVNENVKVLAPIVGITKMILFDNEKVKEKYGIHPRQIIDYKALVGDASDGYPGVAGIGPKTADNLLNEYETLENLYENLEKVKQKNPNLALKLAEGAEAAGLAKKLATIVTDAPINLELEKCAIEKFNRNNLKKEFEELGFKSLVKRIEGSSAEQNSDESGNRKITNTEDPGKKEKTQRKEKDNGGGGQLGLL